MGSDMFDADKARAYMDGFQAGRRWAAMHPQAGPEEYRAEATTLVPEQAKPWLDGALAEHWGPPLFDEHGEPLPEKSEPTS